LDLGSLIGNPPIDLDLLIRNLAIFLLVLGFTCLAPLFRGRLKPISRVLVAVGFLLGIVALAVVYKIVSTGAYDPFTVIILAVAGLTLFLRPIKNIRWAALVAFILGLLASYYAYSAFHVSTTVMIIVLVAATLLMYLLFKFVEDLLGILGSILSFPPIATIIGTICIVQAILLLMGLSLAGYIPPIHL
jgi:hypothetical protein